MWCSRGCLGPPASTKACWWHVELDGGSRRRGCAAGGVSVKINRLLGGRDLADPDFVAVGIVEDVLARLAVVLKLRGLDAAPADRLSRRFEVGDHDGGERAASLRRVLQEVEPTVLAYRPYGLDVVGKERGLAPEEPFVPAARVRDVTDADAGEKVGEVQAQLTASSL